MPDLPTNDEVWAVCDDLMAAFQSGNDDRMIGLLASGGLPMLDALLAKRDSRMLTYSVPQLVTLLKRLSATRSA